MVKEGTALRSPHAETCHGVYSNTLNQCLQMAAQEHSRGRGNTWGPQTDVAHIKANPQTSCEIRAAMKVPGLC